MKILILTAWYHPFIHPRAHRWTVLAEHWAKTGHEVHVLTARVREQERMGMLNGVQVHRVGFDSLKEWVYYHLGNRAARGRVGVKPDKPGRIMRLLEGVYKTVWKRLFFPDDACIWYFPAKIKLKQLLEKEQFDAMITVSLPFTGHLLGLAARRKYPDPKGKRLFWLADIGDPFSFQARSPNNRFFYGQQNRRLERRVLERADAVTVTTGAVVQKYRAEFGEKAIARMSVIPPILDHASISPFPTPNPPIPQSLIRQSPITLSFFGALYAPTRTPDAFLQLLEQTFKARPALRERLEVHFYGEIFPEFYAQLSAEPAIQLHGLCSREEASAAMRASDILLNIGNVTDFQLPSKVVDYLAAGKPVLHLSYVEQDPFVAFFQERLDMQTGMANPAPLKTEQAAGLLSLKIEEGKVKEAELYRWLDWLERDKPVWSEAEIAQRVAPFLAENVAGQYLARLSHQ